MNQWYEHQRITSQTLLPSLLRAAAGADDFSRSERIFYTTCEFWAAIAAKSILTHLGSQFDQQLRNGIVAFSSIGALQVVNSLNSALCDLAETQTKPRRVARISPLEVELRNTRDPVDKLIANFALTLTYIPRMQTNRLVTIHTGARGQAAWSTSCCAEQIRAGCLT